MPVNQRAARPLVVYIDGGSRNNPGPAAIGVAVFNREALDGGQPGAKEAPEPLAQVGLYIGPATNNVAEYTALLRGLEECLAAGASEIEVRSDSELLVKQMNGEYKVRNEGLQPLHGRARSLSLSVPTRYVHVRREKNRLADGLVNQALDEWERRNRDGDGGAPGR
ncbi:MAG: ribonuclease HI family protein [Bacillota bacterium]